MTDKWWLVPTRNSTVAYPNKVMALVPIAYWKLNETSGTQAADSGGNDLHGTYTNGPTLASVTGAGATMGNAPLFDKINDYVEVAHNSVLNSASFTWSFWLYRNAAETGYASLLTKTTSGSWSDGYGVYWLGSAYKFWAGAYNVNASVTESLLNTWTHYAFTLSGISVTVYINGVSAATGIGANVSSTGTLNFGHSTGGAYWGGSLAHLAFYNTVLSGANIASLAVAV